MLFTLEDEKSGYADYCRAKQKMEMLCSALEREGFLTEEKNECGYKKISENAPNIAKKEYKVCMDKVMKHMKK